MYKKTILLPVICFIIIAMSTFQSAAQQRIFLDEVQVKTIVERSGPDLAPTVQEVYRSYDGTNNNISTPLRSIWGSSNIPLFRESQQALPIEYDASDPKNAMGGVGRPSPRKISNVLCKEPITHFSERGVSAFGYVWGQFLDHDITLTPTGTTEYVPIHLPGNEPFFTEDIPFNRSAIYPGTGGVKYRQQTNLATSWIDGSVVYGSDVTRANYLRTFVNGKMRTSAGNLLPWNTTTGEQADSIDPNAPDMANDAGHTVKTFVAGDVRAAEHPSLTSLHTLFVREHNQICDRLISEGIISDEDIYQAARKEVGALIQAITYQEFLPALGITLTPYKKYKSNVRPDIANTFATAAYRLGHTMVADDIFLRNDSCGEIEPGEFDLLEVFWNPQLMIDFGPDAFLKGNATHPSYETDNRINDILRDFLFGSPTDSIKFGIDLASLNIQRGRDHGLPDYNAVRTYYTGTTAVNFSDITGNTNTATSLFNLYGDINDIDLWVGLLAEDHLPNSSFGITINAMLKSQFQKLRDGDFYFYRHDPGISSAKLTEIRNTTLADVIMRNTSLTSLQANVFLQEFCPGESNGEDRSANLNTASADESSLTVYPNPVNDVLNVDIANADESSSIKLFTANGTLVKTISAQALQKHLQIDVKDLSNGVYVANIISGKENKSIRFVKMEQ